MDEVVISIGHMTVTALLSNFELTHENKSCSEHFNIQTLLDTGSQLLSDFQTFINNFILISSISKSGSSAVHI